MLFLPQDVFHGLQNLVLGVKDRRHNVELVTDIFDLPEVVDVACDIQEVFPLGFLQLLLILMRHRPGQFPVGWGNIALKRAKATNFSFGLTKQRMVRTEVAWAVTYTWSCEPSARYAKGDMMGEAGILTISPMDVV